MTTNPTTVIPHVCIKLGDEHQAMTIASDREHADGSVFVGGAGSRVQISGTPEQLRSLAMALMGGAMEIERQHALAAIDADQQAVTA